MPGISRRFSRFGLLAMAVSATAGPGYLPTVGPAPLRFQPPPPPTAVEPVDLPPLAVTEPPAKPTTHGAEAAEPTSPPSPPVDPGTPSLEQAALEPPPAAPMVPLPPPVPGPMAAQMFLQYFTGHAGTNSMGLSVFAPVGFVPPLPLSAPPSSTATFQTTAPGTP